MKKIVLAAMLLAMACSLSGCSGRTDAVAEGTVNSYMVLDEQPSEPSETTAPRKKGKKETPSETVSPSVTPVSQGKTIVIDPGHAATRTTDYEPVGPGAQEQKMASVIGTRGVSTGVYEFERVLEISKLIRDELRNRGYQVIMTKESNEEVLSNIQRAQIANDAHADAFLRIHADASEDAGDSGAMAMCITADNPYIPSMYSSSRLLADSVLSAYCASTGFTNRGVEETDSMTGNNWSEVPCILLEMGYMTNAGDDLQLASPEIQQAIARGVADGLDHYFRILNQ